MAWYGDASLGRRVVSCPLVRLWIPLRSWYERRSQRRDRGIPHLADGASSQQVQSIPYQGREHGCLGVGSFVVLSIPHIIISTQKRVKEIIGNNIIITLLCSLSPPYHRINLRFFDLNNLAFHQFCGINKRP